MWFQDIEGGSRSRCLCKVNEKVQLEDNSILDVVRLPIYNADV